MTWEMAVRWLRAQPGNQTAVVQNYFDLPVLHAAQRFARSEEFREVTRVLGSGNGRRIADIGAGNGIASFAFAQNGWSVFAVEPDCSSEVGAGAIRELAIDVDLPIIVSRGVGEQLQFAAEAFDVVYARQVLHHANDVEALTSELYRVLRRGGLALITRDHVADDADQLAAFRAGHPLHSLYGGENAYPLRTYMDAFRKAKFTIRQVWGPMESILNFYPGSETERAAAIHRAVGQFGYGLGRLLRLSERFKEKRLAVITANDKWPGRIYSFLLQRC